MTRPPTLTAPQPTCASPDAYEITTPKQQFGQDVHPDFDKTPAKRLVIEDFDGPGTVVQGTANRFRARFNALEWTTITLADGEVNAAKLLSLAERCSTKLKWSSETDITRNDDQPDPAKPFYNYNGGSNTGASSNEVYIGKWVPLTLNKKAPSLTTIVPATGGSGATVNGIKVTGADFEVAATVVIEKDGKRLQLSNIQKDAIFSEISFDALLKYTEGGQEKSAEPGTWKVKVVNPDGEESNSLDFIVTE